MTAAISDPSSALSLSLSPPGQAFVNPDGSAVVYNPSMAPQQGRTQQPLPPPAAPPGPHQHQPANHVLSQVRPRTPKLHTQKESQNHQELVLVN